MALPSYLDADASAARREKRQWESGGHAISTKQNANPSRARRAWAIEFWQNDARRYCEKGKRYGAEDKLLGHGNEMNAMPQNAKQLNLFV